MTACVCVCVMSKHDDGGGSGAGGSSWKCGESCDRLLTSMAGLVYASPAFAGGWGGGLQMGTYERHEVARPSYPAHTPRMAVKLFYIDNNIPD